MRVSKPLLILFPCLFLTVGFWRRYSISLCLTLHNIRILIVITLWAYCKHKKIRSLKSRAEHIVSCLQCSTASLPHFFFSLTSFFPDFLPYSLSPPWFSFSQIFILSLFFPLINFPFSIFPLLCPLISSHPPFFSWADSLNWHHLCTQCIQHELFLSGQSNCSRKQANWK